MKKHLSDFEKLWNRIKSQDFKSFVLRTYDFKNLNFDELKTLVLIHRDTFGLRIKRKEI